MKSFRQRLLGRETLIGTHLSMNDVSIGEIIGNAGFDYVWVDTEHSTIDYDHLQGILIALRPGGIHGQAGQYGRPGCTEGIP